MRLKTKFMIDKLINGLFIMLIISSLLTKEAKAYLDPGFSSYLLQILLAGFFSVLLAVKTFWKRIIMVIKQIFGDKTLSQKDEKTKGQ